MAKYRKKNKKPAIPKTRKELRKEKRVKKKESKHQFFSKKKKQTKVVNKTMEPKAKFDNDDAESEIIESDFELSDEEIKDKLSKVNKNTNNNLNNQDRFHENQQREMKKQKELQKKMRKRRIEQLQVANEEDDKIIKRLEKKLKIDKHKNEKSVHKMFTDGLDYALELCLPDNIEKMYSAAKEAAELEDSEDEFEQDLAIVLGKDKNDNGESKSKANSKATKPKRSKAEVEMSTKKRQSNLSKIERKYFKDDLGSDLSGSDSEFEESDGNSGKNDESDDSASDIENSQEELEEDTEENSDSNNLPIEEDSCSEKPLDNSDEDNNLEDEDNTLKDEDEESINAEDENESMTESSKKANVWEDIYGRKRDKEGNVLMEDSQKYIPPHVRARLDAMENLDDKRKEKLEKLRRQCKGFLNRLSEANMHKIASEIENVYMNNPRFDVNNTLYKLIVEALITNILAKERMVLEHAMFIALLHGNVGSEIGKSVISTTADFTVSA